MRSTWIAFTIYTRGHNSKVKINFFLKALEKKKTKHQKINILTQNLTWNRSLRQNYMHFLSQHPTKKAK